MDGGRDDDDEVAALEQQCEAAEKAMTPSFEEKLDAMEQVRERGGAPTFLAEVGDISFIYFSHIFPGIWGYFSKFLRKTKIYLRLRRGKYDFFQCKIAFFV